MQSEDTPLIRNGNVRDDSGLNLELGAQEETFELSLESKNVAVKSSFIQTSLNITKLCIGTGVLAIPFAAKEGGLLFHIIGSLLVTFWNVYSVHRLIESRSYIETHIESANSCDSVKEVLVPSINTNQFGFVTYYAYGSVGLHVVDSIMIMLMLGIIIAYEDAILGFAADTPFTSGSQKTDALFMLVIMTPVLFLPNYKSLAKISAIGTFLIVAIFLFIAGYGLSLNGFGGLEMITWDDLFPRSFSAFSNWFGIMVFGYGLVPFTFSIQDSMSEPTEMVKATRTSLSIVLMLYILTGDLISIIFMQSIKSDILSELPPAIFPTLLRILMSIVVITSIPLIIIPAGDLIHDKILPNPDNSRRGKIVYVIRFLLAYLCAIISTVVPDFVFVLSFVGCFCVALLSFAYPPILHLTCLYRYHPKEKRHLKTKLIVTDVILFVWGLIATLFTSFLTFTSMVANMNNEEDL
mmetsp:Transcript_9460/g.17798  ORF Transcript_9460/g.17798 Transcript_9460/m.17798 type:complete len:465 (+) Transcript_9460:72-1466(+)